MLLGHFSVNGKSYYAKGSGAVACREWVDVQDSVQDGPSKAFAGSDCSLCGTLRNGKLFTSNGDGELVEARGFVTLGGCIFYADPTNGSLSVGWQNVNGKWYFFDETAGYARSGWLSKDGSWSYLDPSTYVMKTGWVAVNGYWYYLNSSGYMQRDGSIWAAPGIGLMLVGLWLLAGALWTDPGITSWLTARGCQTIWTLKLKVIQAIQIG